MDLRKKLKNIAYLYLIKIVGYSANIEKPLKIPGFFDVFVLFKIAEIPAKNLTFGFTKGSSTARSEKKKA